MTVFDLIQRLGNQGQRLSEKFRKEFRKEIDCRLGFCRLPPVIRVFV